VKFTIKSPLIEHLMLRPHRRCDVIRVEVLCRNYPGAENYIGQPDVLPSQLSVSSHATQIDYGLVASSQRLQNAREKFERRKAGGCRRAYLKAQRTDQLAVDIQPHEVGVGSMISTFKESPEGILRYETGTQIGSITELKNSVPLDVAPGEPARSAL
jgi:hypothetical protein